MFPQALTDRPACGREQEEATRLEAEVPTGADRATYACGSLRTKPEGRQGDGSAHGVIGGPTYPTGAGRL